MYKPLFSWFVKVLYVNNNGIGDLCYYIRTCPEFRKWFWSFGAQDWWEQPHFFSYLKKLRYIFDICVFCCNRVQVLIYQLKHFWKFSNVSEQYELGVIKVSSSIFWATILIVVCPGKFASNPWFTKMVWSLFDYCTMCWMRTWQKEEICPIG